MKYRVYNKLKFLYKSFFCYINVVKNNNTNSSNKKALVINVSNPKRYIRYFYTLLKFFSLEGYEIFVPSINYNRFRKFFFTTHPANYFSLILKEGLITFGKTPDENVYEQIFELNDKNLSPDYFSLINHEVNAFYIPMTMHPLFYHHNHWNKTMSTGVTRKRSVFMAGNFDKDAYSLFPSAIFNMNSRIETVDYLDNSAFKKIRTTTELNSFLQNSDDNVCVVLDSRGNGIEMAKLRGVLSQFSFYLALPGVIMPFSHNLIEALSVGTIPIIHRNYGQLMRPKLEHMKNAIFYNDLDDLSEKINLIYNIESEVVAKLRSNVEQYYQENLTPQSVIKKITTAQFNLNYLQAEDLSVELLTQRTGQP